MSSADDILSHLPGLLDYAVLERIDGGERFRICGVAPEWLEPFFGAAENPAEGSFFLEDFIGNAARECWKERSGTPERSGIWEETSPAGEPRHFEALAICVNGADILIIEAADERHDREQLVSQKLHEDHLERHRLGKEIEKKEILLDCIMHDLSGPLATILMNLQHVSRKLDREDLKKSVERAVSQAKRQRQLIGSIADLFSSDLSVFEAAQLQRGDPPDLPAVAGEIIDAHRESAGERGIEMILSVAEGLDGGVAGEASHLGRVLENLILNAIRHSPDGGKVTVQVKTGPGGNGILTEVLDEGPGVDPEIAEILFKPFVQGNSGAGQSGLGLYFCKRTVELWGGEIGYRTRSSGGACFWFRLLQPAGK